MTFDTRKRLPRLTAILGCAIIVLAGCGTTQQAAKPKQAPATAPAETPKTPPAAAADWKLQFSDAFDRTELGKDWIIVDGSWSVENKMLSGHGTIMCARQFPGSQRLDYDAMSDDPCDLSGVLNGNAGGDSTGYFFGFGSDYNAFSKLLVLGGQAKQYDAVITRGKLHHVVRERDGTTLRHLVDGKVVMTYTDPDPLTGPDHDMVGLYVFTSGKFGNVRVYTKPDKPAAGAKQ